MPEFFSSDGPYFLQFLVIFLVILVLLMGAVLLFRRLAGRGLSLSARAGNRARQPRLGIVDIYELDRQRQLILLRRDNVEHLLLVGGPNDVVVERNVVRGAGSRLPGESLMRPEPAPDFAPEPDGRGDPRENGRQGGQGTLPEPALPVPPTFEMPVVVPPPIPGGPIQAGPERAAAAPPPLDPGLFEPEAEPSDRAPAPPSTVRIGISQLGRILRRTPPPLVEPRSEPASERAGRERPSPEAEPAVVPPPPAPRSEPGSVDADILSDMTRQLEKALREQASAVPPPPSQEPAPPPPVLPAAPASERVIATATTRPGPSAAVPPPPPVTEPRPDPIAAAMAAEAPSVQGPSVQVPPAEPTAPPQPQPTAPPPAAKPAPAQEPRPPQEAAALSVEEIETEFARLLGRSLDKKS